MAERRVFYGGPEDEVLTHETLFDYVEAESRRLANREPSPRRSQSIDTSSGKYPRRESRQRPSG